MRDAAPQTIYLADYQPFGFDVTSVELTFDLHPTETRVHARIAFAPKPDGNGDFFLHGEGLTLISAHIDGAPIHPDLTPEGLRCAVPDAPFVWESTVQIDPQSNTALEGLYMSNGMYCTQCEAEGFRKITYYPDRPDVMSIFTVHINGPHPVLLSNGNPVSRASNQASWHDPWPKPAYLFALVAGDLVAHTGHFTTRSGRPVDLNLYVRPGDENKCAFGMQALKASMEWDERVYGREYDLDVFNIVAVDDFNMGAMENKGLNIFNSSAVLAAPETATDANFERIEAIIAHEYFHNWTGNRITCRDWFQLCLKEGLTVFRDSQFTADMRSAPVKRISDVIELRARQFPEDQGPLAHPVRPESFQEINNFYTATVYEKGAELIGMLRNLVGADVYAAALDLYFQRHDGQACTIEDWIKVFEDQSGRDLSQFKRWYEQPGTPRVTVAQDWSDGVFTLTLCQSQRQIDGLPAPQPLVIPVALGLLDETGQTLIPEQMLVLDQASQSFEFKGLPRRPVPSILRGFSAPVILDRGDLAAAQDAVLSRFDSDPFNRWEAGRNLARASLMAMITAGAAPDPDYLDGLSRALADPQLDPQYRALLLALPTQADLAQTLDEAGHIPDPDAIHAAHTALRQAQANQLRPMLAGLYADHQVQGGFSPDAAQAGQRALANAVLGLISLADGGQQAQQQFDTADNMTLQLAALANLLRIGAGQAALKQFETQWSGDRLVMDKWFGLQVQESPPEQAIDCLNTLTQHADFNWKNPNRFRSVLGSFAAHHAGFHRADGAGYAALADWLIRLDPVNPQTTARLSAAFQSWRRYDPGRQALISAQLERILAVPGLSRDTAEMIGRIRSAPARQ